MVFTTTYPSPIGNLLLAAEDDALIGLWIEGQKYYPTRIAAEGQQDGAHPALLAATDWLDRYFAGQQPSLQRLVLRPKGTPFRQAVWQLLQEIPYGTTVTYGQLAAQLAARQGQARTSARAVGNAVGHNPISILIPCHRVVGSGGRLTGYAGGIERKQWLLALEQAAGNL